MYTCGHIMYPHTHMHTLYKYPGTWVLVQGPPCAQPSCAQTNSALCVWGPKGPQTPDCKHNRGRTRDSLESCLRPGVQKVLVNAKSSWRPTRLTEPYNKARTKTAKKTNGQESNEEDFRPSFDDHRRWSTQHVGPVTHMLANKGSLREPLFAIARSDRLATGGPRANGGLDERPDLQPELRLVSVQTSYLKEKIRN